MARSRSSYVAKAFGSSGVFATAVPTRDASGNETVAAKTSGAPTISATEPSGAAVGDLWHNTAANTFHLYMGGSEGWVLANKDNAVPMSIALS